MVQKAAPPMLFPLAAGGNLKVKKDLLHTLSLDMGVLQRTYYRKDHNLHLANLKRFVNDAEKAWESARGRVAEQRASWEAVIGQTPIRFCVPYFDLKIPS